MIITITNRKGGVGKTTFAHHIAAGLALSGYNVGLVDTDSQGSCAANLGLPPANSLFSVLVDEEPVADHLVQVPQSHYAPPDVSAAGSLWLLRGDDLTHKVGYLLEPQDIWAFYNLVEDMREIAGLDVIIVDSQPSMSQLDGVIYLATDAFVYVTECEFLSIQGLVKSVKQLEKFNQQRQRIIGKPTRVLSIIPNKYRTNTLIHQNNVNELGKRFGSFDDGGLVMPPVRLLTVWAEASQSHMPVFLHEPTGEAAGDVWKIIDRMVKRVSEWNGVGVE